MSSSFAVGVLRTGTASADLEFRGALNEHAADRIGSEVLYQLGRGRHLIRLQVSALTRVEPGTPDTLVRLARQVRQAGGRFTVCGSARRALFDTAPVRTR